MKQSNGRRLLAILCVLSMSAIQTACIATTGTVVTSVDSIRVACGAFEPIKWSSRDTDLTIRQAKEHNAAGKALGCW